MLSTLAHIVLSLKVQLFVDCQKNQKQPYLLNHQSNQFIVIIVAHIQTTQIRLLHCQHLLVLYVLSHAEVQWCNIVVQFPQVLPIFSCRHHNTVKSLCRHHHPLPLVQKNLLKNTSVLIVKKGFLVLHHYVSIYILTLVKNHLIVLSQDVEGDLMFKVTWEDI